MGILRTQAHPEYCQQNVLLGHCVVEDGTCPDLAGNKGAQRHAAQVQHKLRVSVDKEQVRC